MTALSLSDCSIFTGGTLVGGDALLSKVVIDTRKPVDGAVYFAISGESFDGHQFVVDAVAKGAVAVVVEHDCGVDVPQLIVRNTRQTLADVAQLWRRQFDVRLVAITGSNGKTTVKEMVASILSQEGSVLATKGNLNNDIGVPLTLFELNESHRFAVVELGASAPGEISGLAAIAEPQLVVVNNVGPAHLEGFGSIQGVADAKGEIYEHLPEHGIALINDDQFAASAWAARVVQGDVVRFAMRSDASVDIQGKMLEGQVLRVSYQGDAHDIKVSLLGQHNMRNALTAVSVALAMGVSWQSIVSGLEQVQPVAGRLLEHTVSDVRVIDDTYNANPGSAEVALELLATYPANRWFVLGTMAELGSQAEEMHAKVARQAASLGIERFACVGEFAVAARRGFGPRGLAFDKHDELAAELLAVVKPGDTILVKGSRSAAMERVVQYLIENLEGRTA
ncbi:UDP-N-acetylmuramoyl-tripeptide--D-alanyl-D-alanine ligase-like [Oratosquilla oratoria]|uniref:UDP-N-acetylmuramoyl-tripeptide--D-alanyl-D- alanine ligase-like n=1 Tax=Oratosquilla oratoria TaxID=337810 RepID=UPI003F769900